jgi:pseudaminic acid synthase
MTDSSIQIGEHRIGRDHPPFVIAEMSGNHNQSIDRALEIVEAAAAAGAHALKLQTYTADSITLDVQGGDFFISDEKSLWKGSTLHDLYQKAATPYEWHAPLFARARKLGMVCFSTPFDESAVDFLETLDVPAYKIASFENIHLPLIEKVASTGKPVIISTGMATVGEIDDAVNVARKAGCRSLVLLKCTSTYPASEENSNVVTIPHLRRMFNCEVGLSDHTMGLGASIAAVAHGATVIEKHLTLRRSEGGVDSAFSLEPEELRSLVIETERAWRALGVVSYGPTPAERAGLVFRRSIYIAKDMKAGDVFTAENLRCVRPGMGLPPKFYKEILGRRVVRDAKKGSPMSWELLG